MEVVPRYPVIPVEVVPQDSGGDSLTKSQIVEEALALFFKAVLEVQRGHRVGLAGEDEKLIREFTSPALSQVEWATHRETVRLSDRGFDRMQELVSKPPRPTPTLRAATARRKR